MLSIKSYQQWVTVKTRVYVGTRNRMQNRSMKVKFSEHGAATTIYKNNSTRKLKLALVYGIWVGWLPCVPPMSLSPWCR